MKDLNKIKFSELSELLNNIWYKYPEVPDYIKQAADYFQYLETLSVTEQVKRSIEEEKYN